MPLPKLTAKSNANALKCRFAYEQRPMNAAFKAKPDASKLILAYAWRKPAECRAQSDG